MTTDNPPQHLIIGPSAIESTAEEIRYSEDGSVCMVYRDGDPVRCPTGEDMDRLPVGEDATAEEIETWDGLPAASRTNARI